MEECVEAPRPCCRISCTDRNHLDLEVLSTASMPCLAHRVPLQETKQPKALNSADVKTRRAHPWPGRARQQHVGTERLVAALGYTTVNEKSFARARKRDCLSHLPFKSDVRSFFYRRPPRDVQSCDDARRCHTSWPPSRQSRARSSADVNALLCESTVPLRR